MYRWICGKRIAATKARHEVAKRSIDSGIPSHSGDPDRLPLGFLHSRFPLGFQVAAAVGGLLVVLAACVLVAVLLVEGIKQRQR